MAQNEIVKPVNWPLIGAIFGGLLVMFIGTKKLVGKIKSLTPTSNIFDTDAWRPVVAPVRFTAANRSPEMYAKVIDQFQVDTNPRYTPRDGLTWCNVFTRDVIQNSVADRAGTGTIPQFFNDTELNANATYDWLNVYGPSYGWSKVSAEEAQRRANAGHPTVVAWKNESGGSGHIAVVRPGTMSSRGPAIAQAGRYNFNNRHVKDGFGNLSPLLYFTTD